MKKTIIIIIIAIIICATYGIYIYYQNYENKRADLAIKIQEELNEFSDIIGSEKTTGNKIIRLLEISSKMLEGDVVEIEIDGTKYRRIDEDLINKVNKDAVYAIKNYVKYEEGTSNVSKIYIYIEEES